MQHLPLFADLRDRDVLIVGGGVVAERRANLLLDAGARITVLSPSLTDELASLVAEGRLTHLAQAFADEPLDAYWVVVAATNDTAVNERVATAAAVAKRFCNVVDDRELSTFIMPAIVERDPVTIAIGSSGTSPVLARWIKGLIESWLPARLGALAALAGRSRERAREAVPDAAERRRFWEHVVHGPIAEHAFAGRDEEAERALLAALASWGSDEPARQGEAYLVGAGPGNPELITIRGRQLLASADVVLYDRLATPELLKYARREAELVCVGKTPRRPSISQKQLNRLLVGLVQSGKRVCRLKGGDPFVFGRGGEEIEALVEAGLRFQVVPGVSAAEGCAAYSGIPLTLRGVSQTVLLSTGHNVDSDVPALPPYRPQQTLAFYMGVGRYAEIATLLVANGHPANTPVAIVERGTTEQQRVICTELHAIAVAQETYRIEPPALLIVGETTRFAERYGWFGASKVERHVALTLQSQARASL